MYTFHIPDRFVPDIDRCSHTRFSPRVSEVSPGCETWRTRHLTEWLPRNERKPE